MKQITIMFDCHGAEILKYLLKHMNLNKEFKIVYINLNLYVSTNQIFTDNKQLDNKHIDILKDTYILILQVIETDRGFLNNDEIIKYCKKDCNIIKIPHYRNSIYEYKTIEGFTNKWDLILNWKLPNKIKDINNIDETINIIKNEIDITNNFPYNKEELEKHMNFKLNEFEKIDSLSDIKMLDYYKNNYKKYRLFKGRGYPSSLFFYELSNRILIKLGYEPNNDFIDLYFAENTSEPIMDYWYKFCNFTFDNTYYTTGHIDITDYEWYYILLLSNDVNIISREINMMYISKIRK